MDASLPWKPKQQQRRAKHNGQYWAFNGTCNSAFTYSLEPRAVVYYVRLNFNISKLVYYSYLLVLIHNTQQNLNYFTYLWCLYLSHTPTIKKQIEDRFISPLRKVDSRRFNLKSRQQLQWATIVRTLHSKILLSTVKETLPLPSPPHTQCWFLSDTTLNGRGSRIIAKCIWNRIKGQITKSVVFNFSLRIIYIYHTKDWSTNSIC